MVTLMLVAMSAVAYAKPTDAQVDSFKSSIMNYIKQEGYVPSIDSDGDVQFKSEGENYWVRVSAYDNGYYVTVMTLTAIEGENMVRNRRAMDHAMGEYKFVRLYTMNNEKTVTTQYNWYCSGMGAFKEMFGNALDVVKAADKEFCTFYAGN